PTISTVFPYTTLFRSKKYMSEELGIPSQAIIAEPYARHTTTNLRNAVRLVYLFNLPVDKPILVVTDPAQTQMVMNLAARCQRELDRKSTRLNSSHVKI